MAETLREFPPMETSRPSKGGAAQPLCPYLEPAHADWIHRGLGYCRGVPRGLLMVPTETEYRALCSTADHVTCPIHRSRRGEDSLEAWLMVRYQRTGPIFAGGVRPPRPRAAEATSTLETRT